MNIRLEEEKDYFEVENLTREAFWNVYRPGCFEHLIVHKIRNDKCFVKDLDYVIEDDDIAIKVVDTPLKFLAMYLEGNNNE